MSDYSDEPWVPVVAVREDHLCEADEVGNIGRWVIGCMAGQIGMRKADETPRRPAALLGGGFRHRHSARRLGWLWSCFEGRGHAVSRNRSESVTGLPSQPALGAAAQELEQRSLSTREPVTVVQLRVADASVVSDDELREIASLAEAALQPFARLYEESRGSFVLLLPASDAGDAIRDIAEIQCAVLSFRLDGGQQARMAAGVSSSLGGEPFLFAWVRSKAEEAVKDAEERGELLAVVPSMNAEMFGDYDPTP